MSAMKGAAAVVGVSGPTRLSPSEGTSLVRRTLGDFNPNGGPATGLHSEMVHPVANLKMFLDRRSAYFTLQDIPSPLRAAALTVKVVNLEPVVGFEPTTDGLQNRFSYFAMIA